MMQLLKRVAAALLTLTLLAAGALLPTAFALWQDNRQIGRIETAEVEPIAVGQADTSLIGRLRLCSQNQLYCEVEGMEVGTGMRFQETTVEEQARAQIDRLHELGILSVSAAEYTVLSFDGVSFLADPGDPSNNGMFWQLVFGGENGSLDLLLDDETGLIVSFEVWSGAGAPAGAGLDACGAAWADYLGLTPVPDEDGKKLVLHAAQSDAEAFGVAVDEETYSVKMDKIRWQYGGVTLRNADDPEGAQIRFLLRASEDTFYLVVA